MMSKQRRDTQPPRKKGQALVEMALLGLLLGMLLAGAVDLGRAYYTAVVVTNMAGEGAAFGAINPDKDYKTSYRSAGACGRYAVSSTQNIQQRASQVANERGLVISPQNVAIQVSPNCRQRNSGQPITVRVTYTINDLFLPGLLGLRNIRISKTATQYITVDAYCATNPSGGTCSNN